MAHRRAILLLLAATCLVPAGCSRERVPLPPADASPQEVVRAYVHAINASDCGSMEALSDPSHSVRAWCDGMDISDLEIGEPFPDGCCGPSENFARAVNVPVTFTLSGGDASMPDGEHAWGYILVRDDDGQRWRVLDEGVG